MRRHYPQGGRLSALEKNELKRRALEMVLLLFYVEDLKQFVTSSIQATNRIADSGRAEHRPQKVAKRYKAAWTVLVDAGVLTRNEADEVERLIDYRNLIAHQMYRLTGDISHVRSLQFEGDMVRYNFDALKRARYLRNKVRSGMRHGFVLPLPSDSLWFQAAERTYIDELKRLNRKIRRQGIVMQRQIDEANVTMRRLEQSGVLQKLQPGHPNQIGRNGRLTDHGVNCCRRLFEAGASPFVVAHLMRLSLRVTAKQHYVWRSALEAVPPK